MEHYLIKRLGHQGDGIADGPVFAALTLPGETVTGTRAGDRLSDIRIISPSADRVAPPCSHFKACGGCQVQHATDEFVAGWKQDIVRQALAANGLKTELRPVQTSAMRSRRRAVISAKRTKKGAMAGFHARASDVIVPIPNCTLLHPDLMAALPVAEALAIAGASRRGALSVTATLSRAGLDIAVEGGLPADGPLLLRLAQEAERLSLARLTWDGEIIATRQQPLQHFGKAQVIPPPGAFLQATQDGERMLLAAVREVVGDAARIADLFAGCGTFTLPLSETAEVHAVEGNPAMMQALDHGWRRSDGLKQVTTETRDLFRRPLLAGELRKLDACVIDPPRAGAEAQTEELCKAAIPRIAYVSCNPVSFARDVKRLTAAGYGLNWVQVVDQFRWSSHVELVGSLSLTSR